MRVGGKVGVPPWGPRGWHGTRWRCRGSGRHGREQSLGVEKVDHLGVGGDELVSRSACLPVEFVALRAGTGIADLQDILTFVRDVVHSVELAAQRAEGFDEFAVDLLQFAVDIVGPVGLQGGGERRIQGRSRSAEP